MCTNLSDMYEKSFVNLCQHRRIRQNVSKCANCSSGFQNKKFKTSAMPLSSGICNCNVHKLCSLLNGNSHSIP